MSASILPSTGVDAARRDEEIGTVLDPIVRRAGGSGDRPPRRASAAWAWAARRGASWTLVLAIAVIAVGVLWAVVPGIFTSYDPIDGVPADKLLPPSAVHWFGTDAIGRDVYARVVFGAIHSLSGALIAVTVGLTLGTALGVVAGTVGGILDDILMRTVDVLLSIPGLLLSLSIIILLGFGTVNAAIAVGIGSVASFARLSRSEVVRVRRTDYVEAAFGSGGTFLSVLLRHVLPNSLTAVVGLAALQFGAAILAISTLGFLGYGAPPPTPEWGLLIAEGRNYVSTAWWLTTLPGLVVVVLVLCANRISQSLGRSTR
ncbi:putative D,D-dipeptide transport system permease protein DdpC [Microbacterium lemovicicum]|uniref:Putative D,D-dipeptide transport system permease protein DdpC n=1 Tax=Microbacterium lemovicicum TaxID=1072463 RepID=A0A3S9WBA4_9MICO|nr:ABC transporter permease [Microbacterium lemovicicum]AZS37378.1 putative D,D-dipeptide transport system permease protein DdpC [Microbacterium lemovicicum]